MNPALHVGDTVMVTPSNPGCVGRGRGVVERVGPQGLVVQVRFPEHKYPIACFADDCRIAPDRPGPTMTRNPTWGGARKGAGRFGFSRAARSPRGRRRAS